tara:strand:+ start:197 stop:931 length:735 start_codon:yes stop_codon:yes gene_type:complete
MKIGIKLWTTNYHLYPNIVKLYSEGKINHLELKYVIGEEKNLHILKEAKIPIVLHSPNTVDGACFSDNQIEKNTKLFKDMVKIADYLDAKGIIIHPEIGSKENFIRFIGAVNSKRIIIENVPKKTLVGTSVGYSPDDIKEYLSGDCNFCLDFCHAVKAARSLSKDYKEYIKEFLELNPVMFHLCDGFKEEEMDEHLNLGEGNFDLKFIKECIEQSEHQMVTLETPKENLDLNQDLENINYLKNI